jgi:hypothetical protein
MPKMVTAWGPLTLVEPSLRDPESAQIGIRRS